MALAATALLALTAGCGTPTPDTTPRTGAVVFVHTAGPRSRTVTLTKPVTGYVADVACSGKGEMEYRVVVPTDGGSAVSDGGGSLSCPGTTTQTRVDALACQSVTLEITKASDGVTGIVQLAPRA